MYPNRQTLKSAGKPAGGFRVNLWFICPCVDMVCFMSRVFCIRGEGGGGKGTVSLGLLPRDVRIPLHAGGCCPGWGGGGVTVHAHHLADKTWCSKTGVR